MSQQLPLPISLADALSQVIRPALQLLPGRMTSPQAEVMLLAIALQEARLRHRRQIRGPARGLWQFETGGVLGVLRHPSSRAHAAALCDARGVQAQTAEVYARLEHDDVLAAGIARLLLWTDPQPLPKLGAAQEAWDLYIRTWRPGKPHRHTWDGLYHDAHRAVIGGRA